MTTEQPNNQMEIISKTELLFKNIRKTKLFREKIPMEAGLGWPIPLRKDGNVYAILLCFGVFPTTEKDVTALYPPFAAITIDWANQKLVNYVNFKEQNPRIQLQWEGQIGTFPHPSVTQFKPSEYREMRQELLSMYDEMFDKLSSGANFSSEWTARFSYLLGILLEPALQPYYRLLGGKFCNRFLGAS